MWLHGGWIIEGFQEGAAMSTLYIAFLFITEFIVIILQFYWLVSKKMPNKEMFLFAIVIAGIFGLVLLIMGLVRLLKNKSRGVIISGGVVLVVLGGLSIFNWSYLSNCEKRIAIGARLEGCDFSNKDLSSTNFSGTNLTGAYFDNSNLTKAEFTNADLTGVNFNGANVTDANFHNANLSVMSFENVTGLTEAMLIDAFQVSVEDLPYSIYQSGIIIDTVEDMINTFTRVCSGTPLPDNIPLFESNNPHTYFAYSTTFTEIAGPFSKSLQEYSSTGQMAGINAIHYTEIVVCIEQHQKKVGCGPYSGKVSALLSRLQYEATLTIREVKSAKILGVEKISSELPDCPAVYSDAGPDVPYKTIEQNGEKEFLILSEPIKIADMYELIQKYTTQ